MLKIKKMGGQIIQKRLESNKTNGHKQDSQGRLRSTMTEGGQT